MVKSPFFVPNLLIFEPCLWVFACHLRAQIVPFLGLKRVFRAQLVPFSSPDRASFEPKKIFFRAEIVPISNPNRTSFEPCSCCYRALSYCVHSSIGFLICCAAKLGDFLQQISFSKHNDFIRTKLV